MKTSETWLLVEAKKEELRKLTNRSWNTQEWEMGALGERILNTVNNSIVNAGIMRHRMNSYEDTLRDLHRTLQSASNPSDDQP